MECPVYDAKLLGLGALAMLAMSLDTLGCSRSALDEVDPVNHEGSDATLDAINDSDLDDATDTSTDATDGSVLVCGPSSCGIDGKSGGCCWKGECVPALDLPARNLCGKNGEQCAECTGKYSYDADVGGCFFGTCAYRQANCGPANCDGCCIGGPINGFCAVGTFGVACGRGGQPCSRCYLSEGTGECVPQADGGGLCLGKPPCSATTCKGCCFGSVCAMGTQDFACGVNGNACRDCVFMEQKCSGGQCVY